MFDLLVKADAKDRGRSANEYYRLAMDLAHATAAIDLVPSPSEVAAIDRFRTMLLQTMDTHGVPRPGQPDTPAPAERAGATVGAAAGAGTGDRAPAGASDRGVARRTRRPHRSRPREGGGPSADVAAAHPGDARRPGPADDRDVQAPGVQRQPGHRQDHGRPTAVADLPLARGRDQGASRRDRSIRPRRRLRGSDGDADPDGDGVGHSAARC